MFHLYLRGKGGGGGKRRLGYTTTFLANQKIIHYCCMKLTFATCSVCGILYKALFTLITEADVTSTNTHIIIIISTGCGVVCTAAVLIPMVTIYVHLKRKKSSGYNIGMWDILHL